MTSKGAPVLPAGLETAGATSGAVASVGRFLHPLVSPRATGRRDTFHEVCASPGLWARLGAAPGDWLLVSGLAVQPGGERAPWAAKLVEEGRDAVVCPFEPESKVEEAAHVLFLPSNALEFLEATPGCSLVQVTRPKQQDGFTAEAARLVLARVRAHGMERHCHAALRSFFHVPRVLAQGEFFGVPFTGLPPQLLEIEDDCAGQFENSATSSSEEEDTAEGVTSLRPGSSPAKGSQHIDPLGGLVFSDMCGFRVQSIESTATHGPAPRCFIVDRDRTEVLMRGSCQARDVPYLPSHIFCAAPPPLPPALLTACKRLIGTLAPAVRAWLRPGQTPQAPHRVLISGGRGCGKRLVWRTVCQRLGLHLVEVNCHQLAAQGQGSSEEALQRLLLKAAECSPALLCLRRLEALGPGGVSLSPVALQLLRRRLVLVLSAIVGRKYASEPASATGDKDERSFVVLAGSCEDLDEIGGPVRRVFQLEITLPRPDEEARAGSITQLCPMFRRFASGRLNPSPLDTPAGAVAKLTAGLSLVDLKSVCNEVVACKCQRSGHEETTLSEVERIEQAVKRIQGGTTVAVALASKVNWEDVGGLQEAKDEVMNCITLPLTQGQMFGGQKVRSGVLLFGPPGTGKTLLAKAVATECRVHFLSVKGPELLSMYIGESERNVRNLFRNASALQPCVLFFDELDSLAPARGRGSDSGGVMDRVVSQLVTELDALPSTVFLIGATNRPDLLDRSLLRPGRLDRMVYLGIAQEKTHLLRAVTRKFDFEESGGNSGAKASNDLIQALARACPSNLTGADVSVLCSDAYAIAQKEHIVLLEEMATRVQVSMSTLLLFLETIESTVKSKKEPQGDLYKRCVQAGCMNPLRALVVRVGWRHFQEAMGQLQPSVTLEDLQRYEQLATEYQNTRT